MIIAIPLYAQTVMRVRTCTYQGPHGQHRRPEPWSRDLWGGGQAPNRRKRKMVAAEVRSHFEQSIRFTLIMNNYYFYYHLFAVI